MPAWRGSPKALRTLAGLLSVALLLSACAAPPSPGGGRYLAPGGNIVSSLDARRFEVIARPGDVGSDFFCAAGAVANGPLDARATDRVVLVAPRGPSRTLPGREAATFAVASQNEVATNSRLLLNARRPGQALTVAHARILCGDDRGRVRSF